MVIIFWVILSRDLRVTLIIKHRGAGPPLCLIHRPSHHAWIVTRLVSYDRHILVVLLTRSVQNHIRLTFVPLNLDPHTELVLLAAGSRTVLQHVAPLHLEVRRAAESVRLHPAAVSDGFPDNLLE